MRDPYSEGVKAFSKHGNHKVSLSNVEPPYPIQTGVESYERVLWCKGWLDARTAAKFPHLFPAPVAA